MFNYQEEFGVKNIEQKSSIISDRILELKPPKGFSDLLIYVISELLLNVKEHSKTKKVYISVKINRKRCLLNISDKGIGFKRSYILKKIHPKDDFSAIEFALGGLSTKDFSERGFGLYSMRKLIEEIGGEMVIESGKARVEIRKNKMTLKDIPQSVTGANITLETPVQEIDIYKIL